MEKMFNLVFDNWDGDRPLPNGKKQYPDRFFWDIEEYMYSYINGVSGGLKSIPTNACKVDDIDLSQKYYYFICHGGINMEEMFNTIIPISNEIKNEIKRNPNFFIVFQTHHESDSEQGFKSLIEYIKKEELNEKQFFVINNNAKLNEYKVKHQTNINVYTLSYLQFSVASGLNFIGGCEFIPEKNGKFFMTFNKTPKIHRCALLVKMLKHGLLENTNWSFIPNIKSIQSYDAYERIFEISEIDDLKNEIDYFNELKIKISDYEPDYLIFDENNNYTMKFPQYNVGMNPELPFNYENTYVNITTESEFLNRNNTIQITEKSLKPFYYYQIPIFFATTGHLKEMEKRYNLDFFSDIINNEYDNEIDDKKRFKMVFDEILRLNENKDVIIDFYKNNKDRFERNKKIISSISGKETDYFYYKKLIENE